MSGVLPSVSGTKDTAGLIELSQQVRSNCYTVVMGDRLHVVRGKIVAKCRRQAGVNDAKHDRDY